jgi:hypothetical protein
MKKESSSHLKKNEKGYVLIVSLLVMALLVIIGISATNISRTETQIAASDKAQKTAFFNAEAGVQYTLAQINNKTFPLPVTDNTSVTPTYTVPNGYDFTISAISKNGTNYSFTSTGRGPQGAKAVIRVVFQKTSNTLPPPDGAMGVYGPNSTIHFAGSGAHKNFVDGRDYDPPANFYCSGANCAGTLTSKPAKPGLYTENTTPTLSNVYDSGWKQNVYGDPPVKTGGGNMTATDWQDFANELIPLADNTINGTPTIAGSLTLGTRDDPQITYVTDDTKFAGSVDGAGILIVEEGATFQGTFHFEGLIIVLNKTWDVGTWDLDLGKGNAYLFGAVVVAGNNVADSEVELRGNAKIRYSSQALNNVGNKLLYTVSMTSWREVR